VGRDVDVTLAEHEQKARELQERLAAKRAEQDQRQAAVEAAEQRAPEVERLAVLVELGELDVAEGDAQKAAIASEIDDAREAVKVGAAAVEDLEQRVEAAGEEWAKAYEDEALAPGNAVQAQVIALQAALAAKVAEREAMEPAGRAAKEEAQLIRDQTRETSAGRKAALDKQSKRTRRRLEAARLARHGQLDAAKAMVEHSPPRFRAEVEAEIAEGYREYLAHQRELAGDPAAPYTVP
jgi:hypothetical protein